MCSAVYENTPYWNGANCVAECTGDKKYLQDTYCVAKCASNAFAEEGEHLHCQDECTGKFINDSTTDNMSKCVAECPESHKFHDGQQCKDDCPFYHNESGVFVCDKGCNKTAPYMFREDDDTIKCVAKCPDTDPWLADGYCVKECQNGAFTTETSDDVTHYKCADSCPVVYAEETNFEKTYKHCYDSCASAGLNYDTDGKCDMGCL